MVQHIHGFDSPFHANASCVEFEPTLETEIWSIMCLCNWWLVSQTQPSRYSWSWLTNWQRLRLVDRPSCELIPPSSGIRLYVAACTNVHLLVSPFSSEEGLLAYVLESILELNIGIIVGCLVGYHIVSYNCLYLTRFPACPATPFTTHPPHSEEIPSKFDTICFQQPQPLQPRSSRAGSEAVKIC